MKILVNTEKKIQEYKTANYTNFNHTFGIWGEDDWNSVG